MGVSQNKFLKDIWNFNINLPILDNKWVGHEERNCNEWASSIRTEKQILLIIPLIMSDEFSFMNLDRDHFRFACSIIQFTIFNVATPMHQFDVIPSKPSNHTRVHQTLAIILHAYSSGADVTAATCDIDFEVSLPVFTLYYSKNKITMEKDQENASQLCELVQDYAVFNDCSVV